MDPYLTESLEDFIVAVACGIRLSSACSIGVALRIQKLLSNPARSQIIVSSRPQEVFNLTQSPFLDPMCLLSSGCSRFRAAKMTFQFKAMIKVDHSRSRSTTTNGCKHSIPTLSDPRCNLTLMTLAETVGNVGRRRRPGRWRWTVPAVSQNESEGG